jgi:tellurite resistance protein
MPREVIEHAKQNRNAALVEVMLLAASADGELNITEMRALLTRVIERPEFEGTKPAQLNALIEDSAKRLAGARQLEDVLVSLRERLPDHRNRLLAFGLATAIALSDRKATRVELGLLKTFQKSLGISEEEVTRIFDMVEQGRSISEALGEPSERLFAETMVLVAASDGVVKKTELVAMLENMAGDPVFANVSLDEAERFLGEAVQSLSDEGMPQRLAVLAQGLTTQAQRTKAFRLALKIAKVDGEPSVQELRTLDLLQATFGIADDDVARFAGEP